MSDKVFVRFGGVLKHVDKEKFEDLMKGAAGDVQLQEGMDMLKIGGLSGQVAQILGLEEQYALTGEGGGERTEPRAADIVGKTKMRWGAKKPMLPGQEKQTDQRTDGQKTTDLVGKPETVALFHEGLTSLGITATMEQAAKLMQVIWG